MEPVRDYRPKPANIFVTNKRTSRELRNPLQVLMNLRKRVFRKGFCIGQNQLHLRPR
jgi:hypothetical protein